MGVTVCEECPVWVLSCGGGRKAGEDGWPVTLWSLGPELLQPWAGRVGEGTGSVGEALLGSLDQLPPGAWSPYVPLGPSPCEASPCWLQWPCHGGPLGAPTV